MRKLLLLSLIMVLAVTSALAAIPEAKAFSAVGTLTLNTGERPVTGVIDSSGGYAYFSVRPGNPTSGAGVVKVRLSDFTRVGVLTLNTGECCPSTAVIDPVGAYAYLGRGSSVIKIRLSDFTRVGTLALNPSESLLYSSVIDPAGGYAYFGDFSGVVVKVRLSDFARVGSLALSSGDGLIVSAVIDPAGGYAYWVSTSVGKVVKVRLSDFTRVGSLAFGAGEYGHYASVIDLSGGYAYFGTATSVVKVHLSDFARIGALTLNQGEAVESAAIDVAGGYAYFGTTASVVKVRLSDFTRVGSLTLSPSENFPLSAVIDSTSGYAYFGTGLSTSAPSIVVKVRLSDLTRVGSLTLNPGESLLFSAVIDSGGGYAYFGSGEVVRVRLSDFTRIDALNPGVGEIHSAVIDPASGYAYFGSYLYPPGYVVKVELSASASPSPPSAPSGLTASLGASQVSLSWNVPSSNGGSSVTGYKVYRGPSSGSESLLQSIGNVTSYTDTGIIDGQKYYYQVSALNSAGEGSRSNEASVTSIHITSTTVSCAPSTVVVSQATSCTATVTDTVKDPTAPTGTVSVTPRGSCTLAGTGASATCSVTITPIVAGSLSVSASYLGDTTHQASSGSSIVTVAFTTTCGPTSCTIASNSTISNTNFGSNILQFDSTGPVNTVGYANVTVPASLVPSITQVQISIYGAVIPSSQVQTGFVTGIYWLYFTFTFHSTAHVSITLVPASTTGALKVTVSGSNGALQGATVMVTSGPSGQTLPAAGTTSADGSVTFANLAPGTYTYKVTANGYDDKQVTVTVTARQTQSSPASLTPVQQAPSKPSVDYTPYAGLGVVVVVVLLGLFLVLRRRRGTPKSS